MANIIYSVMTLYQTVINTNITVMYIVPQSSGVEIKSHT